MPPAPAQHSYYAGTVSPRRRAVSLALAILANALLLALLFGLAPAIRKMAPSRSGAITFQLDDGDQAEPSATKAPAKAKAAPQRSKEKAEAQPETKKEPPPPPVELPPRPLQMMIITRDEFATGDISRLPKRARAAAADDGAMTADAAGSQGGGAAGRGPQGQRLYNAEWYREPTDAELGGYMPRNGAPPGAWATIACRTVADYHVEDCVELGESPAGSGYGRAVRQAAWQFLVRPPRVGGKSLVGEWVRITIYYGREKG